MTDPASTAAGQQDAAARYARGQLRGEELDAFEDYLMEHPELLEHIEAERVVRVAFRQPPAATGARAATAGDRRWPSLAAAAMVLLSVGVGVGVVSAPGTSPGGGIATEIRLETTRSGAIPAFAGDIDGGLTLFSVDAGPSASGSYDLVLRTLDGRRLLALEAARVRDGYLQFVSPDLAAGSYLVEMIPTDPGSQHLTFQFEIR